MITPKPPEFLRAYPPHLRYYLVDPEGVPESGRPRLPAVAGRHCQGGSEFLYSRNQYSYHGQALAWGCAAHVGTAPNSDLGSG